MRRIPELALLGLLCMSGPVLAQGFPVFTAGAYSQNPEALVRYWYLRYFSRPADLIGMAGWAQMIRQGLAPANVLSAMLSSQEYYDRAGNTPQSFAQTLFRDVTGRMPTRREFNWMMSQLNFAAGPWERAWLAYNVLQRHPQGLYPPFGLGRGWPEFDYRRPSWGWRP
jgi:hypothetical protein